MGPRYRAHRGAQGLEPGYGRHLHPLAPTTHRRLPSRRLRAPPLPEGFHHLDCLAARCLTTPPGRCPQAHGRYAWNLACLTLQKGDCPAHLLPVGPPGLLLVDFYPRESRLITFRDPSSFLVLYNPTCNDLVARHLRELASKVCSYTAIRGRSGVVVCLS